MQATPSADTSQTHDIENVTKTTDVILCVLYPPPPPGSTDIPTLDKDNNITTVEQFVNNNIDRCRYEFL